MLRCQDNVSEKDTTGYGRYPSSRPLVIILETFVAVPSTVEKKTHEPRGGDSG
jgi:hypothetical protein